MADGAGGRARSERALTRRSGGQADGAHEAHTCGRGPTRTDGRTNGQAVEGTGGLGGQGLHCADSGSGGRADGRTGADGRISSPPVGRMGRQADGRMSGWAWV